MNRERLLKLADEIENYWWDVGDKATAKEFAERLRKEIFLGVLQEFNDYKLSAKVSED